jgi:hypothetical protein
MNKERKVSTYLLIRCNNLERNSGSTLIYLIAEEVGINVEGVKKIAKSIHVEGGIFWKKISA